MSGLDQIRINRDKILSIVARHGASNLRVFGSVARGEDGPESDVDFLVQMAPDRDLLDLIDLTEELRNLLNRNADIVCDEALSPYIKDRVLNEVVAV